MSLTSTIKRRLSPFNHLDKFVSCVHDLSQRWDRDEFSFFFQFILI